MELVACVFAFPKKEWAFSKERHLAKTRRTGGEGIRESPIKGGIVLEDKKQESLALKSGSGVDSSSSHYDAKQRTAEWPLRSVQVGRSKW